MIGFAVAMLLAFLSMGYPVFYFYNTYVDASACLFRPDRGRCAISSNA